MRKSGVGEESWRWEKAKEQLKKQSRSKKTHKKHKPQREEGKPNQRGEKNKGQGNERGPEHIINIWQFGITS